MISKIQRISTKSELLKAISSIQNPRFEVCEVVTKADEKEVQKVLERFIREGTFTVVVIKG